MMKTIMQENIVGPWGLAEETYMEQNSKQEYSRSKSSAGPQIVTYFR